MQSDFNDYLFLDKDGEDNEIYQDTREYITKKFNGIVIGKRNVPTINYYTQAERDIFDPISYGYVDSELVDQVKVEKINYVGCYVVAFRMGATRLVPISYIKKMEK